jgi:hypothetical protein
MSKRLQIILDDAEYREIQKLARSCHLSIAEWARQALDLACRQQASVEVSRKLDVVRAAVRHAFPTDAIDAMQAEIESGYLS